MKSESDLSGFLGIRIGMLAKLLHYDGPTCKEKYGNLYRAIAPNGQLDTEVEKGLFIYVKCLDADTGSSSLY